MMANLFSIFDPSTQISVLENWVSMFILFTLTPIYIWVVPSRLSLLLQNLMMYLYTEFKPILPSMSYMLVFPLAIYLLIMINNVMGLMPYIFTASSHMSFSLSLALPMWIALMLFGWINNTNNLLAHQIPQSTPTILMPFMVIIETISNIIRPMTLAIRLAANMIAGHLLIVLLSSATSFTPMPIMPLLISSQMMLGSLEIAVAFIQAYVFSVLISLYLAEASN